MFCLARGPDRVPGSSLRYLGDSFSYFSVFTRCLQLSEVSLSLSLCVPLCPFLLSLCVSVVLFTLRLSISLCPSLSFPVSVSVGVVCVSVLTPLCRPVAASFSLSLGLCPFLRVSVWGCVCLTVSVPVSPGVSEPLVCAFQPASGSGWVSGSVSPRAAPPRAGPGRGGARRDVRSGAGGPGCTEAGARGSGPGAGRGRAGSGPGPAAAWNNFRFSRTNSKSATPSRGTAALALK